MFIFLKIAIRNILRNRCRSSLTIAAIAIGFASLVFIRAFVDGSHYQMIENYTDLLSGHIQIHALGFQSDMSLSKNIANPGRISATLKNTPSILASTNRIKDFVLLSSAQNSQGALLIGVDPQNEVRVSKLHKRIRSGKFLENKEQIVIGKSLAASLKVVLNDKIVIMAQGFDGSLCSGIYRISGLIDTGAEEIDKNVALITLAAAQELLVMENRVSEIALRTNNVETADLAAAQIQKIINDPQLEILSWAKISPIITQWVEFDVAFIDIILFVVLLVVAAGILNTLMMGILERIREFGIMLALGTKRYQIMLLVTLESIILGIAGLFIGSLSSVALILYFGTKGIDLSKFSTALNNYYTGSTIFTRLTFGPLFLYGAVVLVTSIIIALYPAWKAANLKPTEAIYKV